MGDFDGSSTGGTGGVVATKDDQEKRHKRRFTIELFGSPEWQELTEAIAAAKKRRDMLAHELQVSRLAFDKARNAGLADSKVALAEARELARDLQSAKAAHAKVLGEVQSMRSKVAELKESISSKKKVIADGKKKAADLDRYFEFAKQKVERDMANAVSLDPEIQELRRQLQESEEEKARLASVVASHQDEGELLAQSVAEARRCYARAKLAESEAAKAVAAAEHELFERQMAALELSGECQVEAMKTEAARLNASSRRLLMWSIAAAVTVDTCYRFLDLTY
jgi:chromosome segregation ATPase